MENDEGNAVDPINVVEAGEAEDEDVLGDAEAGDDVIEDENFHDFHDGADIDDDIDSYHEYDDNYGANSGCELDEDVVSDIEDEKSIDKNSVVGKHALDLLSKVKDQRKENLNFDLNIKLFFSDGYKLEPVHKIIVSAFSPYIKQYLINMPKMENQQMNLSDLKGSAVMEIINWMYSGVCNLTEENAEDILESADFLCIDEICELCVDFYCKDLSFKNCAEVHALSKVFCQNNFTKRVRSYILRNFYPLFTAGHLDKLSSLEILGLMSDDRLSLVSNEELVSANLEFRLFNAVKDYINRKNCCDEWLEFLKCSIRLGFLTPGQLIQINKDYSWLGDCRDKDICIELLSLAQDKQIFSHNFDVGKWNKPRIDTREFKYYWTEKIAYAGSTYFRSLDSFKDLDFLSDKKGNKSALTVVRGVKIWLRIWDGIVVVGGITLTYEDRTTIDHGLNVEHPEGVHEFKLKDGDYINRIDYRAGFLIDQITFHTNSGLKYGPYGGVGGSEGSFTPRKKGGFFASICGQVAMSHNIPVVRKTRFCWGYLDTKLLAT
ncbi:hypothetical protein HELRODRAFT_159813 [Helobdella robusta]|uniref:BTB domain-containing protein n=1 Tax=Helobdella robusta TaxID=6412 RepID=T1EPF4_HELRO|nr:hypothetical protein HELRODRAFT_159813 [Helobdella robusta]ESO13182.1 hypothetical protein HELRODRAFT_159813 [Helobdella robusta]